MKTGERAIGEWGCRRPHFTVATQSIRKLRESRVEYEDEYPSVGERIKEWL